MFQLVGAPLVENCLSGFNSSVFAYGQVVFIFQSLPLRQSSIPTTVIVIVTSKSNLS